MKYVNIFSLALIAGLIIGGCSGSSKVSDSSNKNTQQVIDDGYDQKLAKDTNQGNSSVNPNEDGKSNVTLDDMIRRLPGVQVSGTGAGAKIKVRGPNSFSGNTDPLFVVNGTSMSSYSQVYNLVNPNDIASITALKGPDATIYGTRGANGVIVIRTKK